MYSYKGVHNRGGDDTTHRTHSRLLRTMADSKTAYTITANGTDMGTYYGRDEEDALDAYAEDAGYSSYDELADAHGDEAEATEM